jgi:hypothetical protein
MGTAFTEQFPEPSQVQSVLIYYWVFTLLEILSYPTFYDSDHKKFVDLVSDNRIVVATYAQLARDVARIGAYADICTCMPWVPYWGYQYAHTIHHRSSQNLFVHLLSKYPGGLSVPHSSWMFCFSLPEKYVWNLNETSIDFDSMSSHFTSKQMASSELPHLLRFRSQEVCRFGIGQQDCCCDICTTSKRCR